LKNIFQRYKPLFGYFFAAGSGVIVQYLVGTIVCIRFLGFPFEKGILWGFIISFPVGFILAKIFAFKAKGSGNTRREIIKFLMVVIISGLITVKGSYYSLIILTNLFGNIKATLPLINKEFSPIGSISHFSGMGLSFFFNFFTHRKFTFVETGLYNRLLEFNNSQEKK